MKSFDEYIFFTVRSTNTIITSLVRALPENIARGQWAIFSGKALINWFLLY